MRKLLILFVIVFSCIMPVSAMDFTAPEVPDRGEEVMPDSYDTFAEGLLFVLRKAIGAINPNLAAAGETCLSLVAVMVLTSLVSGTANGQEKTVQLVGTVMIGCLLLQQSGTFVKLSRDVISEISSYGKLLLPVMAAALAAQGGTTASAGIYAGTVFFDTLLTNAVSGLIIPLVYIFIALSIANNALDNNALKELRNFVKWLITWVLKGTLYIFTGYITITGVVSGSADAAAIKAAKIALSGVVPVVGSIISDASEAILVSAGVMKSTVGIYGLLATISLCTGPFIQIGAQYLLLKATAAVCRVISGEKPTALIRDFSAAMGFLLAMIGTMCLILLISTVCFMKGVG